MDKVKMYLNDIITPEGLAITGSFEVIDISRSIIVSQAVYPHHIQK